MFSFLGSLFGLLKSIGLFFVARKAAQASTYEEIIEDVEQAKKVKKNIDNTTRANRIKRLQKYRRD